MIICVQQQRVVIKSKIADTEFVINPSQFVKDIFRSALPETGIQKFNRTIGTFHRTASGSQNGNIISLAA